MLLYIAMFITIIYFVQKAKMLCWEIMVSRYVDKKAIWFNSMQVKCAWEHGLCANVCILDHDVTKYITEYDLVKVPTWNFPQNLDREQSVKRPWKTRETAVKNWWKATKNLRRNVWLTFGICCSFFMFFSLKSFEPLVISSSLGICRLQIGWWAAVVAEAVEYTWVLAGFGGFSPICVNIYPKIPKIKITTI